MATEFIYRRRVQFAETDMAGIAHFADFMKWMEEAEHAFFRSHGMSIHEERDGEILGWPRLSAQCDYRKPVRFEDEFEVRMSIEKMGEKTLTHVFTFVKDNEELAKGRLVTICCKRGEENSLESVPIPDEIRTRFAPHVMDGEGTPG
ncbi:MAG: thioesterase family protein [Planctomycetota bacterium]|jgi:YbgC/YbaW family acyl-CoA thioester hydrolase|nr:thioesterase family protein [Planctomycetota bacterium]MDP7248910.1 thioesterase family protein [Planctomycetota bacterium]|tara:strand:- start:26 stop:466 length:441 start_codon:yes stop_codon:yes gene_type:complete